MFKLWCRNCKDRFVNQLPPSIQLQKEVKQTPHDSFDHTGIKFFFIMLYDDSYLYCIKAEILVTFIQFVCTVYG